jgi:hypothetical protein
MLRICLPVLLLPIMSACTGDESEPKPDPPDDTADTADTGTPIEPTWCESQGLTSRDFTPGASGGFGTAGDFDTAVPDFTWSLMDGSEWVMSEEWSGCDVYVMINYYPEYDYPVNLGKSWKIADWLEASPLNVHYFFFSYAAEDEIESELTSMKESIDDGIDSLDSELEAHWSDRVHYVTDSG